jgi:hypothetical protein
LTSATLVSLLVVGTGLGTILRGLDFCFAYLDYILVFSQSLEEHEHHLRVLFDQLQTNGILINPAKFVFKASEVTFLGQ